MRKIATLAMAATMAMAALAPAAFANNPNCTNGKDFSSSMKVQAQDKSVKGKQKILNAYTDCTFVEVPEEDDGGFGGFGGFGG